MRSQTATIDGVTVRWEEAGDGPAVVLVHGIPTSPELWRHVVPLLDAARVVVFEMLGYGRSILAGKGHDLSIAAQARYLNGLLDHLGIEQVVLVGHDLGGGVAQIAAVERPERVAGLVLTNAIAYDSWPIPSVKMLRAVPALTARMPAPALKATLGSLLFRGHDDLAMARESLELHHARYVAADGAAGLARQVTALDVDGTLTVADRLEQLDVPARVVWGLADRFQKARYGERLARALDTRPIGIPGGRHFTPENHPEVVARAIRDVLLDTPVRRGHRPSTDRPTPRSERARGSWP